MRIWKALLRVPAGNTISYEKLGEIAGAPQSSRAVGGAVGRNRIAWLIPCHRVVRKTGALGGYRWGAARKQAMLEWEAAK